MTVMSLLIFGADKFQAKNNRSRIPEKILLISTFFSGTLGAVLGMIVFRHKISKRSFIFKFFIAITIQIFLIILIIRKSEI